jgi:hypothetical protein
MEVRGLDARQVVAGLELDVPFGQQLDLSGVPGEMACDKLSVGNRTANLLNRWGVERVRELAERTPDSFLAVRGAGRLSLEDLVQALMKVPRERKPVQPSPMVDSGYVSPPWESWDASLELTSVAPLDPNTRALVEQLPTLAAWLASRSSSSTVGHALRDLLHDDPPPAVAAALTALEAVELAEVAGARLAEIDAVQAIVEHIDDLPAREREVLTARLSDAPPTLEELGRRHALTRERVRQIEIKSRRRVLDGLRDNPLVHEASAALVARAGEIVSSSAWRRAVAEVLPRTGALSDERRSQVDGLLRQLVGPYVRWEERWYVSPRGRELLDELSEQLRAPERDGEVPPLDRVRALSPGIDEPEAMLDAFGMELFHGRAVRRGSAMQDRAHIVLEEAGHPLRFDVLLDAMPEGTHERSFRNAIFIDPRIVRVDRDEFALAVWGVEEYTGVADAIERELLRRGGPARIQALADDLAARFEVSRSSVVAYARSQRFVQLPDGMVRLREADEPIEDRGLTPLGLQRGCVRLEGRWAYRVVLDDKLLGGYSATIPPAFAAHLGAAPLESILVPSELELPISVVRSALQPSLGRLRPVAECLGLQAGDLLFVVAPGDGDDRIRFRTVLTRALQEAAPRGRASLQLGLTADASGPDLARCLDLPSSASEDEVAARLRARREEDLAEALAEGARSEQVTGRHVADALGL